MILFAKREGWMDTHAHMQSDKIYQRLSLIVIYRAWAGMEKEKAFFMPIFKPRAYITFILNSSIFNN